MENVLQLQMLLACGLDMECRSQISCDSHASCDSGESCVSLVSQATQMDWTV